MSEGAEAFSDGGTPIPDLKVLPGKAEHNFEELVRGTYKSSLALAVKLVGNLEDASDVIQDAYLKAYRAMGSFRGDASFETWFHRIVSNTASTFRARRGRQSTQEFTSAIESEHVRNYDGPEDGVSAVSSARVDLERALAKLPSRLKSVIVLKDLYGLSHKEIAERMQITEGTAKVWLHRAHKKLVDLIFSDRHDEEEEKKGAA